MITKSTKAIAIEAGSVRTARKPLMPGDIDGDAPGTVASIKDAALRSQAADDGCLCSNKARPERINPSRLELRR
ncbi:hypothetical protein [Rhizobium leguminosarum]|uniref:hypothetical protein n=1 Tax=Rhizobium leguminosarum TaxID=384 RepID=UPI0013AFF8CA